jgi:hypothetical protein
MFQHFYLKYKKFIIKSAGDRFELPLPDHESSMQPLHQPAFYLLCVEFIQSTMSKSIIYLILHKYVLV